MYKAITLLALVACTATAQILNGYIPTFLDNGSTYRFAQAYTPDNTRCSYYALVVPAGTGAVQIDVTNPSGANGYLSVSAGFNYYPAADRAQTTDGNAFLFANNNINKGQSGRFFLCTFDPLSSTNNGGYGSVSTTSTPDGNECAAYVPQMHLGGTVYVCLSAYSSSTSGTFVGIQITLTSKVAQVLGAKTNTLNIAARGATTYGSSPIHEISAYRINVTPNDTSAAWTVATSDSNFYASGLGVTSSQRSFGQLNANKAYYGVFVSKSATATTGTFTLGNNPCAAPLYPATTSLYCIPVVEGAANNNLTYAKVTCGSGTCYFKAFKFNVPAASATGNPFYTLTLNMTTGIIGSVYVSGSSFSQIDNDVNPNYQLATGRPVGSSGQTRFVSRYLVPGTEVQVTFYSSLSFIADNYFNLFTATFTQETSPELVIGANALTSNGASVEVASPPATGTSYYMAAPLTTSGSNGYTITVKSNTGSSIQHVQLVTKDFSKIIASTRVSSSASSASFTFNVPSTFVPRDTYYIVAYPSNSGTRSYTYSVQTTAAVSSATTTFVSIAAVVIAIVAMMF